MIGTLTRRIQATCADELSRLRRQMYSLAWQEIREGGVEGAATAMARKPSCVNHGVSVDVVCFAQRAALEEAPFMISVAMHLHPDRRPGEVYWEEADAWAQAVADHDWFRVEARGRLETLDRRVFHYALTEKAPAVQIIPVEAAGS
ncbi:flavin-binding protein dodecin [Pseudarthrobacter sp. W1I19]|uniref:hypothetical protein n=1 Tax=Pseudarthrobacter sp. W1I19 TaxID=3042288 RepID=UPI002781C298|nr:hypothetical protein [Pseudarthrobacter sp. W1I19]MDQ0925557.1 flavin-binding protein dodecin [Pseudarthrobacter sp. W1I19]